MISLNPVQTSALRLVRANLPIIDKNRDGKIDIPELYQYLNAQGFSASDMVYIPNVAIRVAMDADVLATIGDAAARLDASLGWNASQQTALAAAAPISAAAAGGSSVETARSLVTSLQTEITSLEAQNTAKSTQLTQLSQQLAQRSAQIQQQYNNKRAIGIIGIFAGIPLLGVGALLQMQNDDVRMKQIKADIAKTQADQAGIAAKLTSYRQLKTNVQKQIDALPAAVNLASLPKGISSDAAKVVAAASQLSTLEQERTLLTTVRDAAKAIGVDLNGALTRATAALDSADKAVAASQKETIELIKVLISPDPIKASFNLLQGMVKKDLEAALAPTVDRALNNVTAGPAKDFVRQQLLNAIVGPLLA